MVLLDNLDKTLTDMGKDATRRTRDVVDIFQMKAQVGTEKSKLRDLYITIEESYCEAHKDPTETEYMKACDQIESGLTKITELEERISRLGNTVTHPSRDAVLDEDSTFCDRCRATVVSPSQDLMVVGEDVFNEADNMMVEDIKEDVEETVRGIIMKEAEETEE